MIVAIAFAVLIAITAALYGVRYFVRDRRTWVVDASGLLIQGAIAAALVLLVPYRRGAIDVPFWPSFLISFVAVDYAYYWNHRLLHGALWRWHAVHHTASRLDVVVTSRNTLWTPLLIVYVWAGVAAMLLLRDPSGFLLGLSLTAALDLWRHSPLVPPPRVRRLLSSILVTPHEHAWHHSRSRTEANFGANFTIWDRLHGTFEASDAPPEQLGVDLPVTLLFPAVEGR
jgi:sterol desaturase/sphingolipid hydroxylase (fatty acid hydroxylase superfamily)